MLPFNYKNEIMQKKNTETEKNIEIKETIKYISNHFYPDIIFLNDIIVTEFVQQICTPLDKNIELNKTSELMRDPKKLKIINELLYEYKQHKLKNDIDKLTNDEKEKISNLINKFIFVFISYTVQFYSLFVSNSKNNSHIVDYVKYSSILLLRMSIILKSNIEKNNEIIKNIYTELTELKTHIKSQNNQDIIIDDKFIISEMNKDVQNGGKVEAINNNLSTDSNPSSKSESSSSKSNTSQNEVINNNMEKEINNKLHTKKSSSESNIDNIIMNLVQNDSMTSSSEKSSNHSAIYD